MHDKNKMPEEIYEFVVDERIITLLEELNLMLDRYIEKHFGWLEKGRRRQEHE